MKANEINFMGNFSNFLNEAKFNFTEDEVKNAAETLAKAMAKVDKVKITVHDLEFEAGRGAGFELSWDGAEYDGGSYYIKPNGDVINAAIAGGTKYGNIKSSEKDFIKGIKSSSSNMRESVVTEKKAGFVAIYKVMGQEFKFGPLKTDDKKSIMAMLSRAIQGGFQLVRVVPADQVKESVVNEAKDLKVGDTGVDYNDNVVEVIEIGKFDKVAKSFKKEMKADAEDYGFEKGAGEFYLTKTIEATEGNVGDLAIYPVKYDMAKYWGLDPVKESLVTEAKFKKGQYIKSKNDSDDFDGDVYDRTNDVDGSEILKNSSFEIYEIGKDEVVLWSDDDEVEYSIDPDDLKKHFVKESVVTEAKEYSFIFNYNTDEDDIQYIQKVLDRAGADAVAKAGIDSEEMVIRAFNAKGLKDARKAIEADGFEIQESVVTEAKFKKGQYIKSKNDSDDFDGDVYDRTNDVDGSEILKNSSFEIYEIGKDEVVLWSDDDEVEYSIDPDDLKKHFVKESVVTESTVIMDATDPESKDLAKLLKKYKVTMKVVNKEGPSGFPEIELKGKRKDLVSVLASEDGWDDADLAEYIEESVIEKFTRLPKQLNAMWDLKNSVENMVGKHDNGDDYDPNQMRTIEEFIKKIKKSAKSFKSKEEVTGTAYEAVINEAKKPNGLDAFAADEKAEGKKAEIHLATFDGTSFNAQTTDKTWDDGVPVTKNFTRGGYKSHSPKGKHYIIEGDTFWYFRIDRMWYAVKQATYGTPPFQY